MLLISTLLLPRLALAGVGSAPAPAPAVAGNDSKPSYDWSMEVAAGESWANVRVSTDDSYNIVPIAFTASYDIDEVSNDKFLGGIFRGYTQFFFRGNWDIITHGPEHRILGITAGPRYNFVQPGWKLVPYIEAGVGVVFIDSNPSGTPYVNQRGVGQDFNFTFTLGAGTRYDFSDRWFMRLGCEYQHISNAGLSEPQRENKAIDMVGPRLSVGMNF